MRKWAQENGVFVALDDFYEAITFMEPSRPGAELAVPRDSAELDLVEKAEGLIGESLFTVNCQILVNGWVKMGSIHGKLPNFSE